MDVKNAFLNAELEDETIFVKPSPGYESLIPNGNSLQLLKSLYGLKQSSRMWNITIETFIKEKCGMKPSNADACLYTIYNGKNIYLIIVINVDDIFLMTNDDNTLRNARIDLSRRFDMKDMVLVRWILGIRIEDRPEAVHMYQDAKVVNILERFNM